MTLPATLQGQANEWEWIMLLPIGDDNRGITGPAYVTHLLLLANVGAFVLQAMNPEITYGWSVVPYEIVHGVDLTEPQQVTVDGQQVVIPHAPGPTPIYLTILSAMFLHAGFAHIFGNMLFLWIFGDNVEHRFGSLAFAAFYLVSGLAGTAAHIALDADSIVPSLGASGAISGVLGAYLVLFPRNRVTAFFFFYIVSIPAWLMIGLWIAFQLVGGLEALAVEQVGGVAYSAHIGGFFVGAGLAVIARVFMKERDTVLGDQRYGRAYR